MNKQPDPTIYAAEVRRQAEAKWQEHMRREAAFPASQADPQHLLHELQVHQIELEMQNDDLIQARSELEALLDLYTDLYDFSPVGYCTLAQDGAIQQINLTGATLLGVERGNLIQRRFGLFVAPASRTAFSDFLARVFAGQGKEQCEITLQKTGDAPLWVHLEARLDEKQNCRAVMMDITERKQAEEALLKFKLGIERSADAIFMTDPQGIIVYTNPSFEKIYGYTPSDVIGHTPGILKADVVPLEIYQRFWQVFFNKSIIAGEIVNKTKDGRLITIEGSNSPILDAAENIIGFLGIHRDITARKQAEDELCEKNEAIAAQASQFQTILDTLPEGVLLLDEGGRVLLANPIAVNYLAPLTGQDGDRDHLFGSGQVIITHLGGRPLADVLAPAPDRGRQHEVLAGSRTFEIIARPTSGTPGARLWVLVINDVTMERERERYQQAQERLATVGQMAAGIAHDFNNIMGVIVLYAEMLRSTPGLSERQQRQLDTIHSQAQHAANLIRQILDFSRRSVLEKIALDMLPLIKEMIKLLERTLPENIHLELAYDRSEYIVNGDPTRLQQALMNLAVNARDAMPSGGHLTFTCTTLSLSPDQKPPLPDMAAGEWFCLSVTDTGTGISPEGMAHLFEPFFTTKEPGMGTGLGLAQVYGIVKQHNGYITAQMVEGKGTTFTLYLLALESSPSHLSVSKVDLISGRGETILVVEDNPNMRAALVDILEVMDYRVIEAANGREALAALAQQEKIDLVLSDLVMPEMGGQALLQAMRDRGLDLPLVVLSGHPLTNEMDAMQAQGLAGWLRKPPDMQELTALLARVLGQRVG